MLDLIRIVKDIKCQAVPQSDCPLHTVCRYVSIGILIEMSSIQKDIINKCYWHEAHGVCVIEWMTIFLYTFEISCVQLKIAPKFTKQLKTFITSQL
ncbi:hypothetical protein [Wolbachia endosymbiont of Phyllotreta cruciferae]|uniref:hypothetical protein n=1 Tax=Wolbachia endosymbiont of Phyllotreta cruciferae TaxID=2886377 RepID=UPI0020A1613D|nr:hypothetical protein [Wolbachia endosymbiont of Phyllotreta cruciferae]